MKVGSKVGHGQAAKLVMVEALAYEQTRAEKDTRNPDDHRMTLPSANKKDDRLCIKAHRHNF